MRLATFNVNSVRIRTGILEAWLAKVKPDVLLLQETKVEDSKFPAEEFERMGYHVVFHGQQKYNGVAIASLRPAEQVFTGFGDPDWPEDCRILRAVVDGVLVINTYVPNGTAVGTDKFAYKLAWFSRFGDLVRDVARPEDRVVWAGDVNVAPRPEDLYDPVRLEGRVGFHPREREELAKVGEWGWTDCFRKFTQGSGHYSFWEFVIPNGFKRNMGWRIDHVYASPGLAGSCENCWIDKEPRAMERPSDHTPVVADFVF